jgi:hypothetical protein
MPHYTIPLQWATRALLLSPKTGFASFEIVVAA